MTSICENIDYRLKETIKCFRAECNNSVSPVKNILRLIGIESWMISFWLNVLLFLLLCYSWTARMYDAIVPPHIGLSKLRIPDELSHPPLTYVVVPCCICRGHVIPRSWLSLGNCMSRDLCARLIWKGFACIHMAFTKNFADCAYDVEVPFFVSVVSCPSWSYLILFCKWVPAPWYFVYYTLCLNYFVPITTTIFPCANQFEVPVILYLVHPRPPFFWLVFC